MLGYDNLPDPTSRVSMLQGPEGDSGHLGWVSQALISPGQAAHCIAPVLEAWLWSLEGTQDKKCLSVRRR